MLLFLFLMDSAMPRLPPGSAAPTISLETPDGGTLSSEALAGNVVVLNFWASWCRPCMGELPLLQALDERLPESARVVTVSVDRSRSEALNSARRLALSLPVGLDPRGEVVAAFGPAGLPATYLLDGRWHVVASWDGALDEARIAEVEAQVRALVGP